MNIEIYNRPLKQGQYYPAVCKKDLIIGHFSASDSSAEAVGDWFDQDPNAVATAFAIGKDGRIVQFFDDAFWAWHLGSSESNERRTIGVELVNAGPLDYYQGKYYWWTKREFEGKIYDNRTPYKGKRFWAAFGLVQIDAFARLTAHLFLKHNITPAFVNTFSYLSDNTNVKGFATHSNFRDDKYDLGPAFPYNFYRERVLKYYEG